MVVDQNGYAKLLSKCQRKNKLFEDPDFACDDSSVYFKDKPVKGDIEWKRPSVSALALFQMILHRFLSSHCACVFKSAKT